MKSETKNTAERNINDDEETRDIKFAKSVARAVTMHQLAAGAITLEDIADNTYVEKILDAYSQPTHIIAVVDYTTNILLKARKERKYSVEESMLCYTLFIEHKTNFLIGMLATRQKVYDSAARGLMRELKLTSKASWALELLGGKSFDDATIKRIDRLTTERNKYVRCKWTK